MNIRSYSLLLTLLLVQSVFAAAPTGFTPQSDGSVIAPDGLIWYPAIKKPDGTLATLNQRQAVTCCNPGPRVAGYPASCPFGKDGAYLPTAEEYNRLGVELGYGSSRGYDPKVIPDLDQMWYWASRGPGSPITTYLFFSDLGYSGNWDFMQWFAVRCVRR